MSYAVLLPVTYFLRGTVKVGDSCKVGIVLD
jgi:hypothetical protein